MKNFSEYRFFLFGNRLKNISEDLFFFGEHLRLCPWSLALRWSVLGLGLGFFLCPWPWARALCL